MGRIGLSQRPGGTKGLVQTATGNVHWFPHFSNEGVERRLARIRVENPGAGILVVTETVFSVDSDVPDIAGLTPS
ncbi:hypothetical protein GCM10007919_40630 [Rhizobium indigoferae]|nr:hypothetical protein GCM10007919_40630 [Rhizobium indigoferae]